MPAQHGELRNARSRRSGSERWRASPLSSSRWRCCSRSAQTGSRLVGTTGRRSRRGQLGVGGARRDAGWSCRCARGAAGTDRRRRAHHAGHARHADLPRWLAAVHPRYRTPHRAEITVALLRWTEGWLGQAGLMSHRPAAVQAPRSSFAGFRFPPEVIMLGGALVPALPPVLPGCGRATGRRGIAVDQDRCSEPATTWAAPAR
jgi:hypothetical protein